VAHQINHKMTNSIPLYEENYLCLQTLLSDLLVNDAVVVLNSRNHAKINIHVVACYKYTTLIEIKFNALDGCKLLPECVLKIGLYHDARVAEVLSFQGKAQLEPYYKYPNKDMYHKDEKRQLNVFLNDVMILYNTYGTVCEVTNHVHECG